MEGRRLILLGDSLMRQSFLSLGCLAAPVVTEGVSADWRKNVAPSDNPKAPAPVEMKDYPKVMENGKVINTSAAWFGNFTMQRGGKVRSQLHDLRVGMVARIDAVSGCSKVMEWGGSSTPRPPGSATSPCSGGARCGSQVYDLRVGMVACTDPNYSLDMNIDCMHGISVADMDMYLKRQMTDKQTARYRKHNDTLI